MEMLQPIQISKRKEGCLIFHQNKYKKVITFLETPEIRIAAKVVGAATNGNMIVHFADSVYSTESRAWVSASSISTRLIIRAIVIGYTLGLASFIGFTNISWLTHTYGFTSYNSTLSSCTARTWLTRVS